MPTRHVTGSRRARLLALAVLPLAAACGDPDGGPSAPPPAPPEVVEPLQARAAGPAPTPHGRTATEGVPHEVTITIGIGELPDGTEIAVELREVVAGDRRHVVLLTPDGVVDQHVVTDDEHWWWIAPALRSTVLDAEWVHLDVAAIERAGAPLPDLIVDARRPLPGPEELAVGDVVAGHEVRTVALVGPDEARAEVDGLPGPVVVRRRALPPGTTIELPEDATPMREVPSLLGR